DLAANVKQTNAKSRRKVVFYLPHVEADVGDEQHKVDREASPVSSESLGGCDAAQVDVADQGSHGHATRGCFGDGRELACESFNGVIKRACDQHMNHSPYANILNAENRTNKVNFRLLETSESLNDVDSKDVNPLEGRSTLRPADILVFGWAGGKHACVDLTGVSPLVGLRDNGFVAGQAALKAESSKVAKHEKACLENQHVFIPFAFDTFGFLAPEAEEFLNSVQRVVQSNFSTPKTQNFIFSRIGFAIQKRVAAQLVARLPVILL
ncbi:hypothetical protein Tco_0625358, partial [Tanacetum coccineum]